MKYCDVNNDWDFNESGDLDLTTDYSQSLSNRLKCSTEHLRIYYSNYGSGLMDLIGTDYDKNKALFILNETLANDKNIGVFNIDELDYIDNVLKVFLTVDGLDIELVISGDEVL